MRALLTKRETAGENFHFVLAQQIIYGIGFFGVLYSAYIMVIDRCDPYCIRGFPKTLTALQANHQEDHAGLASGTDHREPSPYSTRPDRCCFA